MLKFENINIIKKTYLCIQFWKWISVVIIVTRIRSGRSEVRTSVQTKAFFSPKCLDQQ
jgi:hypothetical protein